jgi:hypothetical protein
MQSFLLPLPVESPVPFHGLLLPELLGNSAFHCFALALPSWARFTVAVWRSNDSSTRDDNFGDERTLVTQGSGCEPNHISALKAMRVDLRAAHRSFGVAHIQPECGRLEFLRRKMAEYQKSSTFSSRLNI